MTNTDTSSLVTICSTFREIVEELFGIPAFLLAIIYKLCRNSITRLGSKVFSLVVL